MAVSHARGVPPPLGDGRVLFLVSIHLGVGCVAFCLIIIIIMMMIIIKKLKKPVSYIIVGTGNRRNAKFADKRLKRVRVLPIAMASDDPDPS